MKKSFFVLLAILALAVFLRTFNLDKVPSSLFGDEVDVGYQAFSLLKTGQDLRGNLWPTLIQSLAEYRAPLYIYSTIPFIATFGLNEWGVRLPAVFWGILGILGLFLLVRKIFNEKIALFSAFFLTISPWHIHYSRASFEVTMLLAFFIFATYFFIRGLEKKWLFILSTLIFALTPYIYSTAVIFMPLLLLILAVIFRKELKKQIKTILLSFLVMVIILLPFGVNTFFGQAGERFSIVSIFTNKDLQEKVQLAQKSESLPFETQRLFHNKPLIWMQNFSLNYLRAFSPEFLFLQGDPNSRHSIHEMGQMYFYEIVLLLIGLWVVVKMENRWKWLILGWLLLAPIPAALTFDGGFHATRNFLMLVPLMILLAKGVPKNKYLFSILFLLFIFNFIFFMHRYFIHFPNEWRAWHFGYKESFAYIKENEKDYEKIVINNSYEPSLIRFLFWTKYDPQKFHKNFKGDNLSEFALDKYYFGSLGGPSEDLLDKKTLYMASARNDITNPETTLKHSNVKLLKEVDSPTGEPIFYLLTGRK